MPIEIYAQTGAVINDTTTPNQANLSLQEEEKQMVQKDVADLLKKAISRCCHYCRYCYLRLQKMSLLPLL